MQITKEMLDALGITRDDILNLAAQKIADDLIGGANENNEDYGHSIEKRVQKIIHEYTEETIGRIVRAKCEDAMAPVIKSRLAEFVATETNSWGEKTGRSMTLTELIVAKTDAYMMEKVDGSGRTQQECRSRGDSFYDKGPRITAAITTYFQGTMDSAMKQVLASSAGTLGKAIEKAAVQAIGDIHTRLSATVTVK